MIFEFESDQGRKCVAIDLSSLRRVSLVEDEDREGFYLVYLSDVEEYKIEFDDGSDAKEFYRKLVFEWNVCCDQRVLGRVGSGQCQEGK